MVSKALALTVPVAMIQVRCGPQPSAKLWKRRRLDMLLLFAEQRQWLTPSIDNKCPLFFAFATPQTDPLYGSCQSAVPVETFFVLLPCSGGSYG